MGRLVYDHTRFREPNLLVPGKQPIGPVKIDWSLPITHRFALCVVGNNPVDLVTGDIGQFTGTPSPTREIVQGLRCIETLNAPASASGSTSLYFPNLRLGSKFTVLTQCRWATTASREWCRIISGKTQYNATDGFEIAMDDDLHRYVLFRASGSAYVGEPYLLDSANGWEDNLIETLAFTADDANVTMYNRGEQRRTGTFTALTNTNNGVAIGSDGNQSEYSFYGQFFYTYIFDRVLAEREIHSLYSDPYQFLVPA